MTWLGLHSLPISRARELVLPHSDHTRIGNEFLPKENLDAFTRKEKVVSEQSIAAASTHQSVLTGWSWKMIKIKLGFCSLLCGRHRSHATPSQEMEQLITQLSKASQWQQDNWLSHTASAFLSFNFISHPVLGQGSLMSLAFFFLTLMLPQFWAYIPRSRSWYSQVQMLLKRAQRASFSGIRGSLSHLRKNQEGAQSSCGQEMPVDCATSPKDFIERLGNIHLSSLSHFRLYVWCSPFLVWGPKPFRQLHFSLYSNWFRSGATTQAEPIFPKGTFSDSFGKWFLFLFTSCGPWSWKSAKLELFVPTKNHNG